MSDFTKVFPVTLAAGGSSSAPVFTQMNLPLSVVRTIVIQFPPGCAGLVGAAIFAGQSPAYPVDAGSFFVFDGVNFLQDVHNQINSGQWGLSAYNTDFFAHTLRVVFLADYWYDTQSAVPGMAVSL